MTQPLDFSNQMLIGRSFKGQNLAGADFRNADIRLCDFRNANLEGTDFSGARAEEFYSLVLISNAILGVVMFSFLALIGSYHLSLLNMVEAVITVLSVSVFMVIVGRKDISNGLGAVGNLYIAFLIGVAALLLVFSDGGAITSFNKGLTWNGIGFCLATVILLWFAYIFFRRVFNQIINATGTDFTAANLSRAKFTRAILKNCDFTNSNLFQTDWTHVYFKRCKFADNLNNQKVRELCISRIGINQDFSFIDLSGLNLVEINLRGVNLTSADLKGTNLSNADLQNANLSKVQAIKTNFTNANLTGACIENWAITSETIFSDVVCNYIFLDITQKERKPASGTFEEGDFAKLVNQSKNTLDFLFRNGIDPQAFDFALQQLKSKYPEDEISLRSVEDLGDGDRYIRLNIDPNAPIADRYLQLINIYEVKHQELESSRKEVRELLQKINKLENKLEKVNLENKLETLENKLEKADLEKQLAVAITKLEERERSNMLNLVDPKEIRQQITINAINSQIGDIMTDKPNQINISSSSNVALNTGDNNQGVIGNISGTVTNTIQQIRETNQPEAPQLSDLLEQLQQAVESSSELGEPEKQKALEYLNQIGEMSAKDPSQKKGMLPILLDAFTGVISKAANLIDPVKKIAAAILSIWQA
jgi:uncharacterized protein YjbI with pentapeptide repeats